MPLLSACQVPPPSNWQDLERLCADLWQSEWDDPALQRHGRSGQAQNGVDISCRDRKNALVGIQCKCIPMASIIEKADILRETEKAKSFSPSLSHFIIANTGLKDANVELFCRKLTDEHRAKGLFSVTALAWEDIAALMQRNEKIALSHYPFILVSTTPLILNNETSLDPETTEFSFARPNFINPRIVQELQGFISDRNETVITVDLTAANNSNRFFGEFTIEEREDGTRIWGKEEDPNYRGFFFYSYVGTSTSGTQIVWTRDSGGGSGVFHNLLFFAMQRDSGLDQKGHEISTRERTLLKILGSISLGDRYYGNVSYQNGLLHVGGVPESSAGPIYAREPFSLEIV